ncbi:MAG: ABC transporter ATP-binding protein [Candidatus Caldatribacteriaceae bacterium]
MTSHKTSPRWTATLHTFLPYIKPYWKAVLLAPLLMVLEVVCDLAQPTLLARIVDRGIAQGDVNLVFRTGLLMIGMASVGLVGGIGCTVAASIASQGFGKDLRSAAFQKIQALSFKSLDRFTPSTLLTRLTNDVTQLQNLVLSALRIMVRAPLLFLGGLIMATVIAPRIVPFLIASVALQIIIFLYLLKKGSPLFLRVQEKIDALNTVIRENLHGVRVVRAFVRAALERERFSSVNQDLAEATVKAFLPIITLMPLVMLIMNLSIVTVLWFGGNLVWKDHMQVGEIMALVNYVTQILFSLIMIGHIFTFVSRAGASAKRVSEILDAPVDTTSSPFSDTTSITRGEVIFENVSFSYNGEPVLKDISFVVRPGEMVAIVGTTGSGKSTLLHLIPRFYDVTQGRILIDGQDIREKDLVTLRSAIAIVFQETILFSGTIEENIRWGNETAEEEDIRGAAKIAQIHDFILSLPEGYKTSIGQGGVNLSGGQKQRIAIARALAKNPVILLLDDCTSAVDLATERRILEGLKKWRKRCTTFFVAQRLSAIRNADKILVLEGGRIVALGRHDELLQTSSVYRDIYRSQMGEEIALV